MVIDFKLIERATNGVISTFVEEGRLNFKRFTDKQIEYFKATVNDMNKQNKAVATSSVIIDFYTDAKRLEFSLYCTRATTRAQCYADVYVDGAMVSHHGCLVPEDAPFYILDSATDLGEGRKRVTIFLPNLFKAQLEKLILFGGQEFTPVEKDIKVLFIGDSITQGYISNFASYTYVNRLAYKNNWNALNLGMGATIFDAKDLDPDLPFIPQEIFIAYGTNDWAKSPDIEGMMREFIKKIQSTYKGIKINLITPIWRGDEEQNVSKHNLKQTFSQLQELIIRVANEFENLVVIDGLKLVPPCKEFFVEDVLHPNDLGFLIYAEGLMRELKI